MSIYRYKLNHPVTSPRLAVPRKNKVWFARHAKTILSFHTPYIRDFIPTKRDTPLIYYTY